MPTVGGTIVTTSSFGKIRLKITLRDFALFFVIFSRLNNLLYENDIFFMVTIAIAGIGVVSRINKLLAQPKKYLLWLGAFLILYISSVLWAEYPIRTINNFIATFGRAIIVVYLYSNMTSIDDIKHVVSVFTITVIINDLFVLAVYGPGVLIQARILDQVSEAGNSNTLGMSSAYAFVLTIIMDKMYGDGRFKAKLGTYIILLAIVLLSGSKKAMLVIALALGLYYIFSHRNKLANIIIIGVVVIIGYQLLINVPALYLLVGNRIESLINGLFSIVDLGKLTTSNLINTSLNSSDRVRANFILYGIQWFREKPFVGHGMANFIDLYGRMYTKSYYAHNNYIEIAVGLGIVGLIIYYSLHIGIINRSIRKLSEAKEAKLALILVILSLIIDFGLVSYLEIDSQFILSLAFVFSYFATKNETEVVEY